MNATENRTLRQALLRLEMLLLDPAVRKNRAFVAGMLADEFEEIGRNGRTFSKAEMLDALAAEPEEMARLEDFSVIPLGEAAALATYRSVHLGVEAHRSSVWIWREGRWQMRYHQGTVRSETGAAAKNAG